MTHEPRTSEFARLDKLHGLDRARFQAVRDTDYPALISKLNDLEVGRKARRDGAAAAKAVDESREPDSDVGDNDARDNTGNADPAQTAAALDARAHASTLNDIVMLETFLGSLGGEGGTASGRAAELIDRDFGSFERFGEDLLAVVRSASAYVVTVISLYDGALLNLPVDVGHAPPANSFLILALSADHAHYTTASSGDGKGGDGGDGDGGDAPKRKAADDRATTAFVGALLRNVDWSVVNARLDRLIRML